MKEIQDESQAKMGIGQKIVSVNFNGRKASEQSPYFKTTNPMARTTKIHTDLKLKPEMSGIKEGAHTLVRDLDTGTFND